jgi:predicted lipoprotein
MNSTGQTKPQKTMNNIIKLLAVVVRSRNVNVTALVINPMPNNPKAVNSKLQKNSGALNSAIWKPKATPSRKTAAKSIRELVAAATIIPDM